MGSIIGACQIVIQANMSPQATVEVWGNTAALFNEYNIPLKEQALEILIDSEALASLLEELNINVGSSGVPCTKGS